MAELFIPDSLEASEGLLICTGDDIDFGSSQADAIVEVTQGTTEGDVVAMCPYGFTLNLEEAKLLRELLNTAIANAEKSNG